MKSKENRLVVADKGWAETVPEWLKREVAFERLALGLASNIKPIGMVGDAESTLYLYTLSLRARMSHELENVYIYLVAKLMKRQVKGGKLPDFMEKKLEEGLTPDEERELNHLKRDLYRVRGGEIHHPLLDAMRQLKKDLKLRG